MARKKRGLSKKSLYLYDDDVATLQRFFPVAGWTVGAREIIHKMCRKMEEQTNQGDTPHDDIELGDFPRELNLTPRRD